MRIEAGCWRNRKRNLSFASPKMEACEIPPGAQRRTLFYFPVTGVLFSDSIRLCCILHHCSQNLLLKLLESVSDKHIHHQVLSFLISLTSSLCPVVRKMSSYIRSRATSYTPQANRKCISSSTWLAKQISQILFSKCSFFQRPVSTLTVRSTP